MEKKSIFGNKNKENKTIALKEGNEVINDGNLLKLWCMQEQLDEYFSDL